MERSKFLKLIATGGLTPVISLIIACNKSSSKKSQNPKEFTTHSDNRNPLNSLPSEDIVFDSIGELKKAKPDLIRADTNKSSRVQLLGYYQPDDGGGGTFYWDPDTTLADNGGTILKSKNKKYTRLGRWKRVINDDQVNVKWFGAKGDGSGADDQPAIQQAIDYASNYDIKKVVIPEGDYTVGLNLKEIRATALSLKDNIYLVMSAKTILRLPADTNEVKYNFLSVVAHKNVTIEGGTIIGNKSYGTGDPKQQSGFGILLSTADDVTIKNTTLKQHWGDGIYIGRYGGKGTKCKNVKIMDTLCDDNRRQGMSVISVDGLEVENCNFNNTKGVAPEAGIDFEPNNPDEVLQNIRLNNIRCENNSGSGILFVLSSLESKNNPEITIDIKNVYIENTGKMGICITKHFNVSGSGYISFENITVKNNGSRAAYYVRNWDKNAPPIKFRNIVAINPNTSGQGGTTQGSALVFFDNKAGYDKGNLHVDGFEVRSDSSAKGKAPQDVYVNPKVWNCSFRNMKSAAGRLHYLSRLDPKRKNELGATLKKKIEN